MALLSPGWAHVGAGSASWPEGALSSRSIGSLRGNTGPIRVPPGAVLAGAEWQAPAAPGLELRVMRAGGRPGPWVPASVQGHDADGLSRAAARFGEPLWIGPVPAVELRARRATRGLRLHFVHGTGSAEVDAAAAPPLAQPVLDAGPGQPAIIARRAWAQRYASPAALAGYGTVELAFVHHTVNANGYAAAEVPSLLRSIFRYHRYARGFLDIAYNFLIDAYGRIWEGRKGGIDMAVIGAHAGGYNAESTGVALLGDFDSVVPSPAALRALEQLLAWKLSLHGIPARGKATVVVDPADAFYTPFAPGAHVSLPRVAGHRDGDLTDCPGDALYRRLPAIRRRVIGLAGGPAQITLTVPHRPVLAGQPVALTGGLSQLDGTPLADAPVELQILDFKPSAGVAASSTVQSLVTASDGSWTASVTLEHDTILRVLHRPAPATVADWNQVLVAPALTLSVLSTSPLEVSGTVSPGKPRITVELHRAQSSGRPLATHRVRARGGSFQAGFGTLAPGQYSLVARAAPSRDNAAGASAPVDVTID